LLPEEENVWARESEEGIPKVQGVDIAEAEDSSIRN